MGSDSHRKMIKMKIKKLEAKFIIICRGHDTQKRPVTLLTNRIKTIQ